MTTFLSVCLPLFSLVYCSFHASDLLSFSSSFISVVSRHSVIFFVHISPTFPLLLLCFPISVSSLGLCYSFSALAQSYLSFFYFFQSFLHLCPFSFFFYFSLPECSPYSLLLLYQSAFLFNVSFFTGSKTVLFSLSSMLFSSACAAYNGGTWSCRSYKSLKKMKNCSQKKKNSDLFSESCDSQSLLRAGKWEGLWERLDVWPLCDGSFETEW